MTALHEERYRAVVERLVAARMRTGLSQEQVAHLLPTYRNNRPKLQSYVSKCENLQRRLDIIELQDFCRVYGTRVSVLLGEEPLDHDLPAAADATRSSRRRGGPRPARPTPRGRRRPPGKRTR